MQWTSIEYAIHVADVVQYHVPTTSPIDSDKTKVVFSVKNNFEVKCYEGKIQG